jgi:predicted deacylase
MPAELRIDDVTVQPGEKTATWLSVCEDFDGPIKIPLLAANGIRPGRCLYVVSGLYGDEYTGIEAIHRVFRELDPERMSGRFIGVPMLNTPAFDLIRRNGPDEMILNRTAGGQSDGFLTEKLARYFMDHIVDQADYGVEIIDIGMYHTITSFAAPAPKPDGSVNLNFAGSYGADLIWTRGSSPTVLRGAAAKAGVDVFMTELGGEGRLKQEHVDFEASGLNNIMKHLNLIEGSPENLPSVYRRFEGFWMHSRAGGIFRSNLRLRQEVVKEEVLATIYDLLDREIEIIRAPYDGIVIGFRTTTRIRPGDWTVWIGQYLDDGIQLVEIQNGLGSI